jgi:hypothetical protein
MTNRHDGPRRDAPVTVIQSATPTRLTQAEAEELYQLIQNALRTQFEFTESFDRGSQSPEYRAAQEANIEASGALFRWQRDHGLTEEAWRRLR